MSVFFEDVPPSLLWRYKPFHLDLILGAHLSRLRGEMIFNQTPAARHRSEGADLFHLSSGHFPKGGRNS